MVGNTHTCFYADLKPLDATGASVKLSLLRDFFEEIWQQNLGKFDHELTTSEAWKS